MPLAMVSLGDLESNGGTLGSEHKYRFDQTSQLLEG